MADKLFTALSFLACAVGCLGMWLSARKLEYATSKLESANRIHADTITALHEIQRLRTTEDRSKT